MASVKLFFISSFFFFVFTFMGENNAVRTVTEFAGAILEPPTDGIVKAEAVINVWQPHVNVSDGLSSFSKVKVADYKESVEAGWIVKADNEKPRFYVQFVNNQFKQGCFNLDCGVFKMAKDAPYPIDTTFKYPSIYGGTQYVINVTINLEVRDNIKVWAVYLIQHLMGYYPASIFDKMATNASIVHIGGGVTYLSNGSGSPHSRTEMGSGHFPDEGFSKAAHINHMQVYDQSGPITEGLQVNEFADNPNCYDAKIGKSTDPNWGNFVYYGGPGGKAQNCITFESVG